MVVPAAAQIDPVVLQPLPRQSLARPEIVDEVDGVLLEQTGTRALLDVLATAVLQDHALDSLALEQEAERQPGRPGADDPHLGARHRPR